MDDPGWSTGYVVCRQCGARWVGVWPTDADTPMQCPECKQMAAAPENELFHRLMREEWVIGNG